MTETEDTKQCPHCAETILADAKVCKHCGRDVDQGRSRAKFVIFIILLVLLAFLVFNWFVNDLGGLWDSFY